MHEKERQNSQVAHVRPSALITTRMSFGKHVLYSDIAPRKHVLCSETAPRKHVLYSEIAPRKLVLCSEIAPRKHVYVQK